MSNNDWMPENLRDDWNNAKDETKIYITERQKDGIIDQGTYIENHDVADYKRASDRLNSALGNGWKARARRSDKPMQMTGEENANINAMIHSLNEQADAALERRGYYRNEGEWYDSYGRHCNDKGERY